MFISSSQLISHNEVKDSNSIIADWCNKTFFLRKLVVVLAIAVLLGNALAIKTAAEQISQSQSSTRKLKLSTPPEYPELARKMNIQGVARVLLTVASDGKVIAVKELGGNPVLVAALVQAVRKWRYEPADHTSEIEVRFEFSQSH